MRVRALEERDMPEIQAIHDAAGYQFPLPDFASPLIEASDVIVDDSDTPIIGAMAKRGVELYLFCAPGGNLHPAVKIEGVRMLHESLRDRIVAKGYIEGYACLPPEIDRSWGRHLQRLFGWQRAWPSYRVEDWKQRQEVRRER